MENFLNFILSTKKNEIYLIGYDDDIEHLSVHINQYLKGFCNKKILFIDVVDFSQKIIKNLTRKYKNDSSWFSNTNENYYLDNLKEEYGNKDNKLANVESIYKNMIVKLSEKTYLNKNYLIHNVEDIYFYIYYGKVLSLL